MRRLLVLAVVLAGCGDSFTAPEGAEPFDPPEWYALVYAAQEECAGKRGDFGAVRWWVAPILEKAGEVYGGGWKRPHDIYVIAALLDYPWIVAHEALHDILQTGKHPPVFDECEWPHRRAVTG